MNIVWKDRKRPFCGLPLSFTKYILLDDKLLIETGFLNVKQEEIRLYRITDITLKKPLAQRIFKVGTIHCCSGDKTTPEFDISKIKKPNEIKELLSSMVEDERMKKRVIGRENIDLADTESVDV